MTMVYVVIRQDIADIDYYDESEIILGIFSTPERATEAANEYLMGLQKEYCDRYDHRFPKNPLTYDDIHNKYWDFRDEGHGSSSIKIVDYELDMILHI